MAAIRWTLKESAREALKDPALEGCNEYFAKAYKNTREHGLDVSVESEAGMPFPMQVTISGPSETLERIAVPAMESYFSSNHYRMSRLFPDIALNMAGEIPSHSGKTKNTKEKSYDSGFRKRMKGSIAGKAL